MRVGVRIEAETAGLGVREVSDRMRLAFGSHAGDVRSLVVRLHGAAPSFRCVVRVRLRGGRTFELAAEAATMDEALRFAGSRAAAAVARKLDTDRILGW